MRWKLYFIILVIILSGILYYNFDFGKQEILVARVIDGDTLELENNVKCRLKGINSPEKNTPYYEPAKNFVKQFEDKLIKIKWVDTDKYNRPLIYAYYNNQLINKQLIQNGMAHLYYYEKDEYYKPFCI